jgi:hypothetical protein
VSTTQTRERLHLLIDELPEGQLPGALRAIERLLEDRRTVEDPVARALAGAPEDDEPVPPEEAAAIQEGLDAIAHGELLSSAEIRRRLGV